MAPKMASSSSSRRPLLLRLLLLTCVPLTRSQPEAKQGFVYPLGCKTNYYVSAPPTGGDASSAVLLLHGARYSSTTWKDLGTLNVLSDAGVRAIAVDLPAHGSSGQRIDRETDADFMSALLTELGLRHTVLVTPSMSGKYGLPLLFDYPELLTGFVPIAPVGATNIFSDVYEQVDGLPTLVIWGQNDRAGRVQSTALMAIPGAKELMIPNAGHACYLEATDMFHENLVWFAKRALATTSGGVGRRLMAETAAAKEQEQQRETVVGGGGALVDDADGALAGMSVEAMQRALSSGGN